MTKSIKLQKKSFLKKLILKSTNLKAFAIDKILGTLFFYNQPISILNPKTVDFF